MGSRITGTERVFRLGPQPTLTLRERLILDGLWSGKSTNQIAEQLGLSPEFYQKRCVTAY